MLDPKWGPLGDSVRRDAKGVTTLSSRLPCSRAVSDITWSPRLQVGMSILLLALIILPTSFGTQRRFLLATPLVFFGAGVILVAGAV